MSSSPVPSFNPESSHPILLVLPPNDRQNLKDTLKTLESHIKPSGLADVYNYELPSFKMGTLDMMMQVSDEIQKIDSFAESLVHKISSSLVQLSDHQNTDSAEPRATSGQSGPLLTVGNDSLISYLSKFQWSDAKWSSRSNIRELLDLLSKFFTSTDTELKQRMVAYNNARSSLASLQRRTSGNFLVCDLAPYVNESHFPFRNSEYLATVLTVVPNGIEREWFKFIQRNDLGVLTEPSLSVKVTSDNDHSVYTAVLPKKHIDLFKTKARAEKFIVRDFVYDPEQQAIERKELEALSVQVSRNRNGLHLWLKTNFSEAFAAWFHLKTLRAHTEAVMLHGPPKERFLNVLLVPKKRTERKVRDVLMSLYGSKFAGAGGTEALGDQVSPTLGLSNDAYYPYVSFSLNTDFPV